MSQASPTLSHRLKIAKRRTRELAMIAKALASTEHPVMAHIIPMRRCNLSCTYCNEYDDVSKPVPIDEMYRRLDKLAVATSDGPEDDPLAAYCQGLGLPVYRGSLADVLDRFHHAALAFGPARTIVRLTADCPLADWTVIDHVVETHEAGGFDYTNNTAPERTFPHGLDAEAMRA